MCENQGGYDGTRMRATLNTACDTDDGLYDDDNDEEYFMCIMEVFHLPRFGPLPRRFHGKQALRVQRS